METVSLNSPIISASLSIQTIEKLSSIRNYSKFFVKTSVNYFATNTIQPLSNSSLYIEIQRWNLQHELSQNTSKKTSNWKSYVNEGTEPSIKLQKFGINALRNTEKMYFVNERKVKVTAIKMKFHFHKNYFIALQENFQFFSAGLFLFGVYFISTGTRGIHIYPIIFYCNSIEEYREETKIQICMSNFDMLLFLSSHMCVCVRCVFFLLLCLPFKWVQLTLEIEWR